MIPAGHQHGLVSMEMLPIDVYGDVGQDVPAAEAVEVEQDVARVARELNAAIRSHGHSVKIYAKGRNKKCDQVCSYIYKIRGTCIL